MDDSIGSSPSLEFLEKRCRKYLKKQFGIESVAFPSSMDFSIPCDSNSKQIIDVVLWGDGLLSLANPYLWPKGLRFRIWVLSHAHAGLVEKMMRIPRRFVGVIPRTAILSESKRIRRLPQRSEKWSLIISGRLDRAKNMMMNFKLAAELQKQTEGKVEVFVCGPSFRRDLFKQIVSNVAWRKPPHLLGDLGFDWHKKIKSKNPVLLNLSTYVGEDFNVSAAQARSLGWSLIVSDWGGFKDIAGSSVVRIPFRYIIDSRNVKRMARFVLNEMNNDTPSSAPRSAHSVKLPQALTAKRLAAVQRPWSRKKYRDLEEALKINWKIKNAMTFKIINFLKGPP